MRFKLYFEDNTVFEGQSHPNSQWKETPDKTILKLEYMVDDKIIVFKGYAEYNHLVANEAFFGRGSRITKIMIMAREDKYTRILTVDLLENKIYNDSTSVGEEFGKQKLTGWKKGILNNPKRYYSKKLPI